MRQMNFLISVLTALLSSCGQTENSNQTSSASEIKNVDTVRNASTLLLFNDTSKFTILNKQSDVAFAFRNDYKIDTLKSSDLEFIETSILRLIDSFNVEGKIRMDKRQRQLGPAVKIDRNYFLIDTSRYKFQIVAAVNDTNERIVWVNAFCDYNGKNWRTDIVATKDGGICYFNSSINLTTLHIIHFDVNGDV